MRSTEVLKIGIDYRVLAFKRLQRTHPSPAQLQRLERPSVSLVNGKTTSFAISCLPRIPMFSPSSPPPKINYAIFLLFNYLNKFKFLSLFSFTFIHLSP